LPPLALSEENVLIPSSFVLFALTDRICALPRMDVDEILPLPRLWKPPGTPDMLAGMLNLAGEAVPVVSLRALFRLGPALSDIYQHVLRITSPTHGRPLAFLVDRVLDVLAADELNPVHAAETFNGCVVAELPLATGGVAHVLATERILLEEERVRLAGIQESTRARRAAWDPAG
jgi:purine-binding chemotaxis protein CheW